MDYDDVERDPPNEQEDAIDVEEEESDEAETLIFDHEAFIKKLREKPQFPEEPLECGVCCSKKSNKESDAPAVERLSLPNSSSLDVFKSRIPYPPGCVPPLSLPSWHVLPLEKRIPYLVAGKDLIYYTRGKLAQKLHRKHENYSIVDQLNLERVVDGPYNALHDPHLKPLFCRPHFHDLVYQHGFVNERDEVLCTLKEFNKFRDYLRTLWCDLVRKEMGDAELFMSSEREQYRAIMKVENETGGVMAKIANVKKIEKELAEFRRNQLLQGYDMNEARLKQWREDRERLLIEQIMRGMDKSRRCRERVQALQELRLQRRRDIITKTIRKFLEADERQLNDKIMMQAAYRKFLLEWLESKYIFCYDRMLEKKKMQKELKESRKSSAAKRQRKLEAYRKAMPSLQEKRKAEDERIWGIVRKYAMRWLEKVRKRLNAPKDKNHESSWIGQSKGVLDDTVKYLYEKSGYEKLDDFIMNIMKLKKQIQAQIELEEAEEAAAAARAAEEEEEAANVAEEAEG